jgi:rhamnosyl/mannosyltransferase
MACRKPLISTELGTGTSFVNQHKKTGLVIPPNSPSALSRAINQLLLDPQLKEKYGTAARARVEEYFSLNRMIEDLMEIYRAVLD